jgi:hypothetical protein
MERHQDDAKVQEASCSALWNLAVNDANKVTLMAAEAHVRIIRAMDRHQERESALEQAYVRLVMTSTQEVDSGVCMHDMEASRSLCLLRACFARAGSATA